MSPFSTAYSPPQSLFFHLLREEKSREWGRYSNFQLCRTLDEAFQDLRGLMAKAQEMVQLAERFRETLAARGAGADGEVIDAEMQRELIEMGIAAPVTKDNAGARYHQDLSREVRPENPSCVRFFNAVQTRGRLLALSVGVHLYLQKFLDHPQPRVQANSVTPGSRCR